MNKIFKSLIGATSKPYRKKLTYLESTGTQKIDYFLQSSIGSEVKILADFLRLDPSQPINAFIFKITGPIGLFQCDYGTLYYTSSFRSVNHVISYNEEVKYELSNGKEKINNSIRTFPIQSVEFDHITIFLKFSFRLFSFKVLNGENIVSDLIPVLDRNNVPCLYDKKSKTFFYNEGSGTFNYN